MAKKLISFDDEADGHGLPTPVAERLRSHLHPATQPDFVQLVEASAPSGDVAVKRVGNDVDVTVAFPGGRQTRHTLSGLDDYLAAMDVHLGEIVGEETITTEILKFGDVVFTSGSISGPDSMATSYTTEVGSTWEFPFTSGSDASLLIKFYSDNRGGMWELQVDDGPTTSVSTWQASPGFIEIPIFTEANIPAGNHVLKGTFIGDDPDNAPTSTARGWLSVSNANFLEVTSTMESALAETRIAGRSNKEFALQVRPADAPDAALHVIPHHGTATAFTASPRRYLLDGAEVSWEDIPTSGAPLVGKRFQVVQHIYGRHPDQPTENLLEVFTTTTIHPTGKISVSGRWHILKEVVLGSTAYLTMLPSVGEHFTTFRSGLGNVYPNTPAQSGSLTWMEPESDMCTSYVAVGGDPDIVAALTIYDPAQSLRQGKDGKDKLDRRVFLEHRSTGSAKIYPRPWASGTVLKAGESGRWAADWFYASAPGAAALYG